jgi:hypothetical protein
MQLVIFLAAAVVAETGVQAEVLKDLQPVLFLASTLEAKKVDKIEGDPVNKAAAAGDDFARAYDKLKIAMTQVTAASEAQKDQKLSDAAASAASARSTLSKAERRGRSGVIAAGREQGGRRAAAGVPREAPAGVAPGDARVFGHGYRDEAPRRFDHLGHSAGLAVAERTLDIHLAIISRSKTAARVFLAG